jgi:hypothetical protein
MFIEATTNSSDSKMQTLAKDQTASKMFREAVQMAIHQLTKTCSCCIVYDIQALREVPTLQVKA